MSEKARWDLIIRPQRGWWDIDLAGIWKYRGLIWLFVKRDFVTFYKQTILGPLWYIIQPLFTTGVFTVVFGKVANISTDGVPPFLFYMAGNIVWNYFSQSLNKTSNTFIQNAGVFGKVYFPRMTVPISTVIINFVQFLIQLLLFLAFYTYFWWDGANLQPNWSLALFPFLMLQMAFVGLGCGILISSLTTKYRDLVFALTFGIQLWMYASPVVYPASVIPEQYLDLYMLNPMAPIVEQMRFMFFGQSALTATHVINGCLVSAAIFLTGLLLFNRVERNFMDTV